MCTLTPTNTHTIPPLGTFASPHSLCNALLHLSACTHTVLMWFVCMYVSGFMSVIVCICVGVVLFVCVSVVYVYVLHVWVNVGLVCVCSCVCACFAY